MRVVTMAILILFSFSCKKKVDPPRLTFSEDEKQWFIYQKGQQFKFKNNLNDSLVYDVADVKLLEDVPEYTDTSRTEIVSYRQAYYAKLQAINDSIIIYFYKEVRLGPDPNKMKQTIRWVRVKNQFAYFAAIENKTPLSSRIINGVTYSKVSDVLSLGNAIYTFTWFDKAYYDQKAGFIEIIDINGTSWKRA